MDIFIYCQTLFNQNLENLVFGTFRINRKYRRLRTRHHDDIRLFPAINVSEDHDKSEELPDISKRLHQQLDDWRRSVEALIPRQNPNVKTYDHARRR